MTRSLLVVVLTLPLVLACTQPATDTYCGYPIPGDTPELFAPGLISDTEYRLHGAPAISPDCDEIFFSVVPPAIMHTRFSDAGWSTPTVYPIEGRGVGAPCFSPDGTRLYFHALLPGGAGSLDIWYMEKTDTGWGDPVTFGPPLNDSTMQSQPSITTAGDVYFTGRLTGSGLNRGIYRFGRADTSAVLLDTTINSPGIDYTPWVSPDGATLLFGSSRPGAEESALRIYASFATSDRVWSKPVNVCAAIGWDKSSRFPILSPDGRFLFFQSDGNIYWVRADVIDSLRPE